MNTRRASIALAMLGLISAPSLFAQTGLELPVSRPTAGSVIPVDSLPPGARALGLAGAFSAVADDATAAEANPAGQVQLLDPEVSIHFRNTDNNIDFYDAEARSPEAFGSNQGRLINNFSDSSSNISFASVVYPWESFVFSAFYTNNADIDATAARDTVFNAAVEDTYISDNTILGELEGFGLSFAWRANDFVSVGLSLKRTELTVGALDQTTVRNFRDFEIILNQFRPDIPLSDFAAALNDEFTIGSNVSGDDSATTFTAGVLFNPQGKFSAALTYKEGSEYDLATNVFFNQSLACVGTGTATDVCNIGFSGIDLSPFNRNDSEIINTRIDLPDILTLGLAWRPTDTWLLSFDINNIDYSDLPAPRASTLGFLLPVNGQPITNSTLRFDDIEPIGDAVTYHFGAEKVFILDNGGWLNLLTLRGGVFTDDDHDGTKLLDTDDTHVTVGIGATMMEYKLSVDVAAEFSDRTDNIVLSAIYRF